MIGGELDWQFSRLDSAELDSFVRLRLTPYTLAPLNNNPLV